MSSLHHFSLGIEKSEILSLKYIANMKNGHGVIQSMGTGNSQEQPGY